MICFKGEERMMMRKLISSGVAVAGMVMVMAGSSVAMAASSIDEGKAIAFDKKKGNCLACHRIEGGRMAGDIAPPILLMKVRYPDKKALRDQIWDATAANPNTVMPPFGRHHILSDAEVDKVTDFIYSL
jgi:sulfur-oxidizing protein SoxX